MLLPYTDTDIQPALLRLLDNPVAEPLIRRYHPDRAALRALIPGLHTVADVQRRLMLPCVEDLIATTMSRFTYTLSPHLDPGRHYLFLANHRDIVFDAMLLDYALARSGHDTPYVLFGSNLLSVPLMADVGRLNKLVSVPRGGTPRDFYRSLSATSDFIRRALTFERQSVWVAQRNGRTKDGLDRTDPAIVKMLALSAPRGVTLAEALAPLCIVPVAISYEWEPCDLLKVRETCAPQPYVKAPGDDTRSVVTGLTQPKGHVHLSVADPLTPADLAACHDDPRQVALLLDRRIHAAYRLHPTNLRPELLHRRLARLDTEKEKQALLALYANPARSVVPSEP
ncbi:MAG: acyltransferase family protein [bacterium P3]|nr:MAG: acyltransferase family protein [bacterium P3]KWW40936.1 MAG: acyltransferase family protein [bacterium F083]